MNEMTKEDLFLDTCIFLSYANQFEKHSDECEELFEKREYDKYTSENVIKELETRIKRRKMVYLNLLSCLSSGKNLDELSPSSEIYLNENDKRHIQELIDYLRKHPIEGTLSQFRLFLQLIERRINLAKNSLLEITPRSSDVYMKDIIKARIENDSDARIIMDAFEWSKTMNSPSFVTLDVGDIYRNKKAILRLLRDYKFLDEDPFRILYIKDLIE
ncbi:MAG TPA: hypothetical protein ENI49_04820 [Thermoplasmatales archaeon]|nr:hypothetical protein [Thermoplasmatales archaeon]